MRSNKLSFVHLFNGALKFLFLFFLSLMISQQGLSQVNHNVKPDALVEDEQAGYVPDQFIVQFNPLVAEQIRDAIYSNQTQTSIPQIDALNQKYGVKKIDRLFKFTDSQSANLKEAEEFGLTRTYVLEIPEGANIEEIIQEYTSLDMVVYAEPNFLASADLVPGDALYTQQWGLKNTGQADPFGGGGPVGVPGADINVEPAWDVHTGSSSVIISILDTGVDYNHPEFAGRIVAGYDFINNDNDPMDDGNHGTACAGIAAAAGNNGIGVAGVNWNALIMPVKVLDNNGNGSYAAVSNGITWAADNGADVLSLSLGGGSNSATLQNAVNYAHSLGCIVMASRGNNNNSNPSYPASFANAIAIGALSPCDERKDPSTCDGENWWGSSFGSDLDVMAPGTRIYTTDRLGGPGYSAGDYAPAFNGTSAACPFAAGAAALLRSWAPGKTNDEIRTILQQTAVDIEAPGFDNETGFGRLNVFAALQEAANVPPVAVCQDVTVPADENCEAEVTPEMVDNGSYDPEGADLTMSLSPEGPYPHGETSVVLTVSDGDESSTCAATITVEDVTPPVVICPPDIYVDNDSGQCSAAVIFSASAIDNCDPAPAIVSDIPSGSTFPVGTTTVSISATDASGNLAECSFDVRVEDTEAPVITTVANPIIIWPPNSSYAMFDLDDFIVSVSDNCTALEIGDVLISSASSDEDEDANGNGDGNTLNDIVIGSECQMIQLRKERAGNGNGRVYTINFQVSDEYGNTSTASAQVHVPHHKNSTAIDDGAAYTVDGDCDNKSSLLAGNAAAMDLVVYPNPFNGSTTLDFEVLQTAQTSVKVFNMAGVMVSKLYEGVAEEGMKHSVIFDASDLPKGVYYFHITSGSEINITKKLIHTR